MVYIDKQLNKYKKIRVIDHFVSIMTQLHPSRSEKSRKNDYATH